MTQKNKYSHLFLSKGGKMKRFNHASLAGFVKAGTLLIVATFLAGAAVYAQSSSSYELSWWTVDGGGGNLSGAGYTLNGSAGQPDAGIMENDGYTLGGGFWAGVAHSGGAAPTAVYLPLVMRNH